MKRRAFATFAVAALSTIVFANSYAFAAQNQAGGNWPSQSCGCSSEGRCYAALNRDFEFECRPDGTANKACQGTCSFTTYTPTPTSGGIMRQNVDPGGNPIGNAR